MAPDPEDSTKQGETVAIYNPPLEQTLSDKIEFSARIDYTDDYKDPRKGIRNIFYYDIAVGLPLRQCFTYKSN